MVKKVCISILLLVFFSCTLFAQTWSHVGPNDFNQPSYYQASYTSVAVAPDGTPYVVYKDAGNGNKATVEKYSGGTWSIVGTAGFSSGAIEYASIAIAPNGTPYVVYQIQNGGDPFRFDATVMKFSSGSWSIVGTVNAQQFSFNGFPEYYPNIAIAIAPDNTPYVAYGDYTASVILAATVKKFDGTSWVLVGTTGFTGSSQAMAISFAISQVDGTPYILFRDDQAATQYAATVMKFDGSNWVLVGTSGFSNSSEIAYPSIAITSDGIPYVAYQDVTHSSKVTVMQFNGTSWVTVGVIGFSTGTAEYISLAIASDFKPYVAYKDVANSNKATVKKFDGSSWIDAGTAGFSAGAVQYTAMSIFFDGVNDIPYVIYQDATNDLKATVKQLGVDWTTVGSTGLSSGAATYTSAAIGTGDGNMYVAYKDGTNNNKATVKKHVSGTWSIAGNAGFSSGNADYVSLAFNEIDDKPYVAFKDVANAGKASVSYLAPDNAWTPIGIVGFSTGSVSYTSLAISSTGTPYIAYADADVTFANKVIVKTYNGTSWVNAGTQPVSGGAASYVSTAIASDGTLYVAYQDATNNKATVMKFSAGSWSSVGPSGGFSAGAASYVSIAINTSDGIPYVAYQDATNNKATVMKFSAGSWSSVGPSGGISTGATTNTSIALASDGTPYVAYQDAANGNRLTTKRFLGGTWTTLGSQGVSAGTAGNISLAISSSGIPYVAYTDGYAWAQTFGGGALPVTLNNFTAVKQNGKAKLQWQTSAEYNSDYFIVEHSINGIDFSEIGRVRASGNSSSLTNYSLIHPDPKIGKNYYRLKQVDIDGNVKLYPIRVLNFSTGDFIFLSLSPNPAKEKIILQSNVPGVREVIVMNMNGQKIMQQKVNTGQQRIELDISHLSGGAYFLLVNYSDGKTTMKFIKN